ncbi:uncharacterized protein TP53INP isoform X1 [Diabrotica undecimpunctata]|uniref:uncharacterized protein TP53INP isoform X1 n=2 Tax=Diabrotica undecimpunctata TaxID=50387 RepID=UPI003B6388A9
MSKETMFQNLANYLLGSVLSQEPGATAEGVEENRAVRLRAEDEDDWVLVDRDSEGNSDTDSVESLDDLDEEENVIERVLTRTSSTSSLPCGSNMEESWFVTPPPCFTSEGPIHMETSPLENLLIEHPSMSVYHIHPSRRHFTVTVPVRPPSSASRLSDEEEDLEVEEENLEGEAVAVVNRVPRLNRLQVMQQQERQRHKSKRAQKVQVQKACQAIKRGNLERNNKAREVNSRNRRQRRGERSQGATRSYANNNRKC